MIIDAASNLYIGAYEPVPRVQYHYYLDPPPLMLPGQTMSIVHDRYYVYDAEGSVVAEGRLLCQ